MSRLYLLGYLIRLLPESRMFKTKTMLYKNLFGLDIYPSARIYSSVEFHTYPIVIKSNTQIGSKCYFVGGVGCLIEIGENCDVGPCVAFITGTHEIGPSKRRAGLGHSLPIKIGDGTWIGARSTILGGVTIGSGCVIAAGSVVTKDVDSNIMVAGVPAIFKKALE